jgi:hypothetical protein
MSVDQHTHCGLHLYRDEVDVTQPDDVLERIELRGMHARLLLPLPVWLIRFLIDFRLI